jgi:hypothetical protein
MLTQIRLNLCFVRIRRDSAVVIDELLHGVPLLPMSASFAAMG